MQYEEVVLEEKVVVGLKARTRNLDPNMPVVIGDLWRRFFEEGTYLAIEDKKNGATIGLYDAYEKGMDGYYDITVCAEVTNAHEIPKECIIKHIPSGRYAKFKIKGHMQEAVVKFWAELWQMDLERSYKADFEEYVGGTPEECDINIYIAI
ncbi:MAG: AraC family transcriptional regulator [Cellulosilyticum sp.]|nr:AraC family transcriptional regulator [Cellulosilyticum sp.]